MEFLVTDVEKAGSQHEEICLPNLIENLGYEKQQQSNIFKNIVTLGCVGEVLTFTLQRHKVKKMVTHKKIEDFCSVWNTTKYTYRGQNGRRERQHL